MKTYINSVVSTTLLSVVSESLPRVRSVTSFIYPSDQHSKSILPIFRLIVYDDEEHPPSNHSVNMDRYAEAIRMSKQAEPLKLSSYE